MESAREIGLNEHRGDGAGRSSLWIHKLPRAKGYKYRGSQNSGTSELLSTLHQPDCEGQEVAWLAQVTWWENSKARIGIPGCSKAKMMSALLECTALQMSMPDGSKDCLGAAGYKWKNSLQLTGGDWLWRMTPEQGGKLGQHGAHVAEAGAANVSVNGPTSGCTGGLPKSQGGRSTGLGACRLEASRRWPRKSWWSQSISRAPNTMLRDFTPQPTRLLRLPTSRETGNWGLLSECSRLGWSCSNSSKSGCQGGPSVSAQTQAVHELSTPAEPASPAIWGQPHAAHSSASTWHPPCQSAPSDRHVPASLPSSPKAQLR